MTKVNATKDAIELAKANKVDIKVIEGTGPEGKIMGPDVQKSIDATVEADKEQAEADKAAAEADEKAQAALKAAEEKATKAPIETHKKGTLVCARQVRDEKGMHEIGDIYKGNHAKALIKSGAVRKV